MKRFKKDNSGMSGDYRVQIKRAGHKGLCLGSVQIVTTGKRTGDYCDE